MKHKERKRNIRIELFYFKLIKEVKDKLLNAHLFKNDTIELINSGLSRGETPIVVCDFWLEAYLQNKHIALLTNKHLRIMVFNRLPLELIKNNAFEYDSITNITKSKKYGILIPTCLILKFFVNNQRKIWYTPKLKEGYLFISKMVDLVENSVFKTNANNLSSQVRDGFSLADEIKKLAVLADEGILTQDELKRAKGNLIGNKPSKSNIDELTKMLYQLNSLKKNGILSESEFNSKKWDLLSKKTNFTIDQ